MPWLKVKPHRSSSLKHPRQPPTVGGALGFTLVELMVAIGVIGILAVLATQSSMSFVVRARQVEAKVNLRHIYGLQEAYFAENDEYVRPPEVSGSSGAGSSQMDLVTEADVGCNQPNPLGFQIPDCVKARYSYFLLRDSPPLEYTAFAREYRHSSGSPRSVFPWCVGRGSGPYFWQARDGIGIGMTRNRRTLVDTWTMTEKGELRHAIDANAVCL